MQNGRTVPSRGQSDQSSERNIQDIDSTKGGCLAFVITGNIDIHSGFHPIRIQCRQRFGKFFSRFQRRTQGDDHRFRIRERRGINGIRRYLHEENRTGILLDDDGASHVFHVRIRPDGRQFREQPIYHCQRGVRTYRRFLTVPLFSISGKTFQYSILHGLVCIGKQRVASEAIIGSVERKEQFLPCIPTVRRENEPIHSTGIVALPVMHGERQPLTDGGRKRGQSEDIIQGEFIAARYEIRHPLFPSLLLDDLIHQGLNRRTIAKLRTQTLHMRHADILEFCTIFPQKIDALTSADADGPKSGQQIVQRAVERMRYGFRERKQTTAEDLYSCFHGLLLDHLGETPSQTGFLEIDHQFQGLYGGFVSEPPLAGTQQRVVVDISYQALAVVFRQLADALPVLRLEFPVRRNRPIGRTGEDRQQKMDRRNGDKTGKDISRFRDLVDSSVFPASHLQQFQRMIGSDHFRKIFRVQIKI